MPVHNSSIAKIFQQVADLLEIEGANQYRVRAYRTAARTIETLSRPVSDLIAEEQDLTELEGIGDDMAGKIEEILNTGGLSQLEEIKARTPAGLAKMLKLDGLGPKRVQTIYEALDVNDLEQLEQAAEDEKIRALEGLGAKTEKKILEQLDQDQSSEERTLLSVAEEVAAPLVAYLKDIPGVDQVEVAGSFRRRNETVGDLDILATGEDGEEIISDFVQYEDVEDVISQGETRSTVRLNTGLQVDLRVVARQSYGAALLYFTGSKPHNLELRKMAVDQDLKVNEYGVFDDEERIAGETENEIYELFELAYIEPELREARGEIKAAREGNLPKLIVLEDLRGDLQMHTKASDGHASLSEMAQAAQELGYEYIAITDHSPNVAVTQGLDAEALAKRLDEIDEQNAKLEGLQILKSIEVDILEDGALDLPDDILKQLDLRVCAIHSHLDLSKQKQTERILRAMDNPYFNILAHPTGRRIHERSAYELDLEKIMQGAKERGCFLEINAQPSRLDLKDVHIQMAKDIGLKLAISTDAHRISELQYLHYGVDQARRGWLEAEDVINTRPWTDLNKLLNR